MSDTEHEPERTAPKAEAAPAPPPPVEESPADALARKLATRGAQVALDPESDAAVAARGGMAPDHQGNVEARDAALLAMGLVPSSPSGDVHDMTPLEKAVHVQAAAGEAEPTPHSEARAAEIERTEAQEAATREAASEPRERPPGAL